MELRVVGRPGEWRFEVADRGGGIPPGEEERLFRPFNRASRAPGSGLGLAIVRGIAEAHGGREGSTTAPARARRSGSRCRREARRRGGAMRLLVVEDEARSASFLVRGLRSPGYAVEHVVTGEEALVGAR